jgi:acyl-CoA synthetase (AMP-forming)/AMP-acid ligase II
VNPLVIAATMARRGMLAPNLPHRLVGQLTSLATWGMSLVGEVRQAALGAPQRIAVIDQARGATTYAELFDRGMRAAVALRSQGVEPGHRIGLMARNHVGAVEVMVGASALGVDLVLVNTGLAGEQLGLVLAQQEIDLLVHDEEFAAIVDVLVDGPKTLSESAFAAAVDALPVGTSVDRPEPAGRTIILTSGTTGVPKGAARRTPKGLGALVSMIDRIPLHVGDRILIAAPIFHTWGYAALQLSFGMSATVILRRRFDPHDVVEVLEWERVQAMFAVPVMLQRMMEQLPADPGGTVRRPSLRVVATSGSAYPSGFTTRFMDEYGDVLYNLYGSTEASWICIATPSDLRRHPDTAGTPPLGTVVRLLDADGAEVPDGETGRIFCGNEMVFEGYTSGGSKEFIDGMVSTGDLGHRADGLYFIDGRDDDMVISGGENVYPSEVEGLLVAHPAVREVSVVGVPDPDFGQRLAAFIALEPGAELSADDVRDLVRSQRARHCVPREVVFLDELPRNTTGKILTRELKARFV